MTKSKPKWPSVEEQLAASRVVKGSALEQLIRDNQDFEMLRPDEAGDKLGLPLWLRVYWRKGHPQLQISATDPLGPYPDTLFKVHAWMLKHPDLPWGSPTDPAAKKGSQ